MSLFGVYPEEVGIVGRYVIYDTESGLYLGRAISDQSTPDPSFWDWNEDGITLGNADLQPMYRDQYVAPYIAPRPPAGLPIGVQLGRFIAKGVGFDRVVIVPIVDATATEGIFDFCKAFPLNEYP